MSRSCLRASKWDSGVNIWTLGSSDHVDGVNIWIALTGRRQEGQLRTFNLQLLPRGKVQIFGAIANDEFCFYDWLTVNIWFCWLQSLHNLFDNHSKSCQIWKVAGTTSSALSLIDAFNTSIVFMPKSEHSSKFETNTKLFISVHQTSHRNLIWTNTTLLFWFKLHTAGLIR